jgi:hypothetical protein
MPAFDIDLMLLGCEAAFSPLTKNVALMPFEFSVSSTADMFEVELQSSKVSATTLTDVLPLKISWDALAETDGGRNTETKVKTSDSAIKVLKLLKRLFIPLTSLFSM